MLRNYFHRIGAKIFQVAADPFEAQELRMQEERDAAPLNAIQALLG
jgi:hypothetical protein